MEGGLHITWSLLLCVRQLFTENCGLTCIVDFKVSQAMRVVITFISPSSRVNNLLYS